MPHGGRRGLTIERAVNVCHLDIQNDASRDVVKGGSRLSRGMPKYADISNDDLESLRHFIRQRARDTMLKH